MTQMATDNALAGSLGLISREHRDHADWTLAGSLN